jgi:hypothetical protein
VKRGIASAGLVSLAIIVACLLVAFSAVPAAL